MADARSRLLERLIDHAPMFPPAQLPLDEALADHEAARASDAAWLLNRFVERESALDLVPETFATPLSIVADTEWALDPRIAAIELPRPDDLEPLVGAAPEVYV